MCSSMIRRWSFFVNIRLLFWTLQSVSQQASKTLTQYVEGEKLVGAFHSWGGDNHRHLDRYMLMQKNWFTMVSFIKYWKKAMFKNDNFC
jgi:hypothetical protein